MFGLPSLTKLLVLAAIVLAVWYGFKLVAKLDAARKEQLRQQGRAPGRSRGRGGAAARRSEPEAEEMVACPACQAFVAAARPSNCGRADCPY